MIQRRMPVVPAHELYARTGIQTMPINTVFQLLAEPTARRRSRPPSRSR